jgi:hypothetical protein
MNHIVAQSVPTPEMPNLGEHPGHILLMITTADDVDEAVDICWNWAAGRRADWTILMPGKLPDDPLQQRGYVACRLNTKGLAFPSGKCLTQWFGARGLL